ncbi:MAG: ZIP family metal transporter, partial [Pseudoxanthomonas sp.]
MNRIFQPLAKLNAQAWPYLMGSAAIVAACAWILMAGDPQAANATGMQKALHGGTMCALATALGALPVLLVRRLPQVLADALLGFGAGVMLAATAFSLVLPGLQSAESMGHSPWGAGLLVSAGLMGGAIALLLLGKVMSDEPLQSPHADGGQLVPSRVLVFVLAIMLHNIPEGMAVGVASGGGLREAQGLAMGIALQDIPEGMVVALILAGVGMTRAKA